MIHVQLYTTAACHLCQLAEDILAKVDVMVEHIEIGDDDDLVSRYGIRIPVIRFPDNSELDWPFALVDIAEKISRLS